ncbi:MAG: mannan-binding lectin [Planctomycetota bacterium]|nr:mannan-binding lectin [Planctomycetota bacterium]
MIVNGLDREIISFRVKYSTPYDEPRHTSSHLFLPPGQDYRVGVQGVILPERILIDLADKTYDFADLSGLNPDKEMRIEVAYEDGRPRLRRLDAGDAEILGAEVDYLTAANRPNAVDRDFLTSAGSWEEIRELVVETANEARERLGEAENFAIEAGHIWNQEHADSRCPEVVEEWNWENEGGARWTGQWTTTVPGEMSVCGCLKGTPGLAETLFGEDLGWGKTWYFPLFWMEWFGVARIQAMDNDDPEEGIGIDLRFSLPEDGRDAMLDDLMSDLRVDGFRPWWFQMETWDDEKEERGEVELAFREGDKDKYYAQDEMQAALFAAYGDSSLAKALAIWVKEETFEKAKNEEEPPAEQGVMLMFGRGTFEAMFIPDGRVLLR